MTDDEREGRDEAPTVAALAIQLSRLRQQIETVNATLDGLAGTQQRHAAVLSDVAELRKQIESILAILDADNNAAPATWFWLTMSDEEHQEKLDELNDWVETVLRQQYPDYLTNQIKPCWPNHPEARWELTWLYQLWSIIYLTSRSAPKDAADWHDRWTPGVIHRLSNLMAGCRGNCRRPPHHAPAESAPT